MKLPTAVSKTRRVAGWCAIFSIVLYLVTQGAQKSHHILDLLGR